MKLFLLIACSLFSVFVLAQTKRVAQGRKLEIKQFIITIPSDWSFDTTTKNSTVFKAKAPLEYESDDFQENMGVRVSDLGGNDITLDLLMRDMEKALSDKMTDFQLLERKKEIVGKEKAESFVFTTRHDNYHIQQKQFYMLLGNYFYVYTFSAKTDSYSKYLPVFQKIIQSIIFKKG